MAAVRYICERIALLKKGGLVDLFLLEDLFSKKRHPYTQMLVEVAAEN
ncbi:hypothetical protein BAOM_2536 [Peribacillus asahii]|uniref:Uncharacterized protein n=1 Tax=Peribacillus asahii TaxID=228899 RepID=A0A3T0KSB4_9BACI|nr:hypothetical protein BAOM_2536 [Peribacillus asahii]